MRSSYAYYIPVRVWQAILIHDGLIRLLANLVVCAMKNTKRIRNKTCLPWYFLNGCERAWHTMFSICSEILWCTNLVRHHRPHTPPCAFMNLVCLVPIASKVASVLLDLLHKWNLTRLRNMPLASRGVITYLALSVNGWCNHALYLEPKSMR